MPGRRRGTFIEVNGNIITSRARPWPAAGPMFEQMADETTKVNARFLHFVIAEMVTITNRNGSRFRLRGSKGNRVPLEAKGDVKSFVSQRNTGNALVVVGQIKGIPQGFWNLVEFGRQRRYLSYSKFAKDGQQRVSRSGRVRKDYLTKKQVQRRFNKNESLRDLKPIRTPYGPRQYAMPGPHGPIGNPWARSMEESGRLIETNLTTYQTVALMKIWKGGT
jgi:hypothetical protein